MAYYYWESEIPKWSCEKIIEEFDTSKSQDAGTGNYQGVKSLYTEEIENYKKHDNWDHEKNEPKNLHTPDHSTRRTSLNWLPKDHPYNNITKFSNEISSYNYDNRDTDCNFSNYNLFTFTSRFLWHIKGGYDSSSIFRRQLCLV